MGDTKNKTETRINERLKDQSNYALDESRRLYDRPDLLPSQYVGISDPRMESIDMLQERGIAPGLAMDEYQKTISGGYLHANPYLDEIVNRSVGKAMNAPISGFASQGRFGSGAFANALADAGTATASRLYGQNYQAERDRMNRMIGMAPTVDKLQYADAGRMAMAGQQLEADQAMQARNAMQQYLEPERRHSLLMQGLGANPLMMESDVTEIKGFDWGSAITGLMGGAMDMFSFGGK